MRYVEDFFVPVSLNPLNIHFQKFESIDGYKILIGDSLRLSIHLMSSLNIKKTA
jgi:hypothetical protein